LDSGTFEIEAAVEKNHWWFIGRRKLIAGVIREHMISHDDHILDVGTSTGTNLRMLTDCGYPNYFGLDINFKAITHCLKKGLRNLVQGNVCSLPFADNSFRLVIATDVLEHVDDDFKAICELERVLTPNGLAIITIPAFQCLWGLQDKVAHHKRRYLKSTIVNLSNNANLECIDVYYFNYILSIPIYLARKIMILFGSKLYSEAQINTKLLNRIFTFIFSWDVFTAKKIRPPFGVSIMLIAKKNILV
jgi:ubiquinone/menaquinone biosynthesis C-methylase UbiE